MRRISNEQEKDTLITKMKSISCMWNDETVTGFLDPSPDSPYTYAHTDITVVDDRLANVILLEPAKNINDTLSGTDIYRHGK